VSTLWTPVSSSTDKCIVFFTSQDTIRPAEHLSDRRRSRRPLAKVDRGGGRWNRVWGWFLFVAAVKNRPDMPWREQSMSYFVSGGYFYIHMFYSTEIKYILSPYWTHTSVSPPRSLPCDTENFSSSVDLYSRNIRFGPPGIHSNAHTASCPISFLSH
jgi:hypothetical protein